METSTFHTHFNVSSNTVLSVLLLLLTKRSSISFFWNRNQLPRFADRNFYHRSKKATRASNKSWKIPIPIHPKTRCGRLDTSKPIVGIYTAAIVPRTIRLSFNLLVSKKRFYYNRYGRRKRRVSHYIRDTRWMVVALRLRKIRIRTKLIACTCSTKGNSSAPCQ